MKYAKRLASLLLVLVLSLAMLTVPAGAQMQGTLTGGKIEISGAYKGETYKAYQILYLESYDADAEAYSYKANSAWESWLRGQTQYVKFDDQDYVTWMEGANVAAFAKAALQYAQTANNGVGIDADGTVKAPDPVQGDPVNAKTTVTITDLKLGYYLVDSSLGAICSLDTTNPTAKIEDKNAVPAVVKQVQEDSTNSYGDTNTADIGDTVTFQTTITAKAGARNYVLHDEMSNGLEFVGVTGITSGDDNLTEGSDYTVVTSTSSGNPVLKDNTCTFEIHFEQEFLDKLLTDSNIVVTYTAKVTAEAIVGNAGNTNKTWLTFGANNRTSEDTTTTKTWEFKVFKYGNNNETNALSDAKFVLLRSNNGEKNEVATIENNKLTGWTNVPAASGDGIITWPQNTLQITGSDGTITIQGLDSGTYYLRETAAPQGYNLLAGDVTVVIDENGNVKKSTDGQALEDKTVKIENKSGAELPTTGGVGTTLLYAAGTILALGAALTLIIRRRMRAEEE